MEGHLFIGGSCDGLTVPVESDVGAVQLWTDIAGIENYLRETLTIGAASIIIFRHESLTQQHVLYLLALHYKTWTVNRPGGRN